MAGIGKPGPVGKRDEERIRRNKTSEDGLETASFDLNEPVEIPQDVVFLNAYVNDLWRSLTISVNVEFYEPSDWSYARLTLHMLDNILLKGDVPGAMLLQAIDGMMSKLLLTEADRRKMKIEAKRSVKSADKKFSPSEAFKQRFEQQRLG